MFHGMLKLDGVDPLVIPWISNIINMIIDAFKSQQDATPGKLTTHLLHLI
jgi:hypothetical protein